MHLCGAAGSTSVPSRQRPDDDGGCAVLAHPPCGATGELPVIAVTIRCTQGRMVHLKPGVASPDTGPHVVELPSVKSARP